jgi:ribosomal protein S18 acetylase RimI-like enzyme
MSFITDLLQAFRFIQQQQGWQAAIKNTLLFFKYPLFAHYHGFVLHRCLSEPVQMPEVRLDLSFQEITADNISLLESIHPPLRVKRMERKIQAGEICNTAMLDKRVIGYVFAGFKGTPSTLDVRLNLSPQEAYLWAGYTLPEFRRQGVVGAVNLDLCRILKGRGLEKVLLLVEKRNAASLGHLDKIGYEIKEEIIHMRILGWRTSRISPVNELEKQIQEKTIT